MKKKKKIDSSVVPVRSKESPWTFLTNHTHVLWCIYQEPEIRLRDVADRVGITERMVQKIVAELAEAQYVKVEKSGRRNVYQLQVAQPLRHPLEAHCVVGEILELLQRTKRSSRK